MHILFTAEAVVKTVYCMTLVTRKRYAKMMSSEESFSEQKESSTEKNKVYTSKDHYALPGFCNCGVLIPKTSKGPIICYSCKKEWTVEVFGDMRSTVSQKFNKLDIYKSLTDNNRSCNLAKTNADCPKVLRECPKCHNVEMGYQISPEEEAVVYICVKCSYTERQEL